MGCPRLQGTSSPFSLLLSFSSNLPSFSVSSNHASHSLAAYWHPRHLKRNKIQTARNWQTNMTVNKRNVSEIFPYFRGSGPEIEPSKSRSMGRGKKRGRRTRKKRGEFLLLCNCNCNCCGESSVHVVISIFVCTRQNQSRIKTPKFSRTHFEFLTVHFNSIRFQFGQFNQVQLS